MTENGDYHWAYGRGLRAGLDQAADWLEKEAQRWPQDALRKRIEDIAGDIRNIDIED